MSPARSVGTLQLMAMASKSVLGLAGASMMLRVFSWLRDTGRMSECGQFDAFTDVSKAESQMSITKASPNLAGPFVPRIKKSCGV
jgi:hypothetical protein